MECKKKTINKHKILDKQLISFIFTGPRLKIIGSKDTAPMINPYIKKIISKSKKNWHIKY